MSQSRARLRAWLNDGGEFWVMLDRVDFGGLEPLLGDTFTCQLVDRVRLDKVAIRDAEALPAESPEPAVEYERPLDFARVLVTGMHVTHTVQGWPAAFWRPVGAAGWCLRRSAQKPGSAAPPRRGRGGIRIA